MKENANCVCSEPNKLILCPNKLIALHTPFLYHVVWVPYLLRTSTVCLISIVRIPYLCHTCNWVTCYNMASGRMKSQSIYVSSKNEKLKCSWDKCFEFERLGAMHCMHICFCHFDSGSYQENCRKKHEYIFSSQLLKERWSLHFHLISPLKLGAKWKHSKLQSRKKFLKISERHFFDEKNSLKVPHFAKKDLSLLGSFP